ncbi:MAG: dockerin type I repeat-containing protein [bacterium]
MRLSDYRRKSDADPIEEEDKMNRLSEILKVASLLGLFIALALLLSMNAAIAQTENVFTRGNVNDDFKVNLGDLEYLYAYLFQGGPEPLCMDAADVNDNGAVDNADYVMLQNYLVGGGAEPMAPFPNRGWDPTTDLLRCSYPTPSFPPWPGHPHDNITVCCALGSQ